jgi:hypothetical protein
MIGIPNGLYDKAKIHRSQHYLSRKMCQKGMSIVHYIWENMSSIPITDHICQLYLFSGKLIDKLF